MNVTQFMREKLHKLWPGLPSDRAGLTRVLAEAVNEVCRLTLATVLGYLLTVKMLPPPVDLTGALTALLVTQASLRGSFRAGMVRVVAVLTGIGTALGVAMFVGLHWWSLGIVVFAGLMLARVLRLSGAMTEVAISGMLILGASGVEVAAFTRFATTVIGTVVGIGLPLLLPRKVRTEDLARNLRRVSAQLREIFQTAADHLNRHPMTRDAAERWLIATRQLTPLIASATAALDDAADLQKWNTRQMFQADVVPLLRHSLNCLERISLASRHLFNVAASGAPVHPTADDGYGDEVRAALAVVLIDLGRTVQRFTDVVSDDVGARIDYAKPLLDAAVLRLRISTKQLTKLMTVDPQQRALWLQRGGMLAAIEQMTDQLDLAGYTAQRDQWRASQLGRAVAQGSIGPRIRTPWSLLAQRRLRARAARARIEHPEGSHEIDYDQTTVLMDAIDESRLVEERPGTGVGPDTGFRYHR